MKSLIAYGVVGGMLLSPTMAAAFDPPFDRCNDVPDAALRSCLKPFMDEISARHQPGERSIFSDVMSKKPVPSDNVAPPSSETMTPYEQRRREERASDVRYEERRAQQRREEDEAGMLYEQRKYREDALRMQALGLFLGSGGFRSFDPLPTYQPPPPIQYAPAYQAPPVRPPVNCTTNTVGQYTYTNCN